jgi:hypothetical protein
LHSRVRILHGGDDFLDPRGYDCVRARRRAALMRTRFERNVKRRATRAFPSFFESQYLGVFHAGPGVKAASDHDIIADDDCADSRIRAHPA